MWVVTVGGRVWDEHGGESLARSDLGSYVVVRGVLGMMAVFVDRGGGFVGRGGDFRNYLF